MQNQGQTPSGNVPAILSGDMVPVSILSIMSKEMEMVKVKAVLHLALFHNGMCSAVEIYKSRLAPPGMQMHAMGSGIHLQVAKTTNINAFA